MRTMRPERSSGTWTSWARGAGAWQTSARATSVAIAARRRNKFLESRAAFVMAIPPREYSGASGSDRDFVAHVRRARGLCGIGVVGYGTSRRGRRGRGAQGAGERGAEPRGNDAAERDARGAHER